MSDTLHRFIFDTYGIRGELVKLSDSSERMLKDHAYPRVLADLLQQCAAVSALLATTLKFEGKISIQLQTPGALQMMVVQTTHLLGYRGLIRYDENSNFDDIPFSELTNDGQMVITISPKKGKQYQGIVPLEGNNLAECIEAYFNQSEQLKTRIWLFNNEKSVFGLLLQALPDMTNQDSFQHLEYLASTLTAEESLSTDSETLLHRLFHEESIRGLEESNVKFQCGCSEKKMLNSLSLLPEDEIKEILETRGHISARCEFCLDQFKFNELDLKQNQSVEGNQTKH